MAEALFFRGVIRNVRYEPSVRANRALKRYDLATFDVNRSAGYGLIDFDDYVSIGYSKWVSPKRTRTYPLARLYNVYHLPKRVTMVCSN